MRPMYRDTVNKHYLPAAAGVLIRVKTARWSTSSDSSWRWKTKNCEWCRMEQKNSSYCSNKTTYYKARYKDKSECSLRGPFLNSDRHVQSAASAALWFTLDAEVLRQSTGTGLLSCSYNIYPVLLHRVYSVYTMCYNTGYILYTLYSIYYIL